MKRYIYFILFLFLIAQTIQASSTIIIDNTEICFDANYFSCSDGIQNGDETGVDCGGTLCPPCPCTNTVLLLSNTNYNNTLIRKAEDWAESFGTVELGSMSNVDISAEDSIKLNAGFEVKLGSTTHLYIEDCDPTANGSTTALVQQCGVESEVAYNIYSTDPNIGTSPICVKLYLHIVRNDDGSAGLSPANITSLQTEINGIFNPHMITFDFCVVDVCNSIAYSDACISDVVLYPFYSFTDGINGFIYPDGSPTGSCTFGGLTAGTPPSQLFWSQQQYVTHELGHALGLHHTFRGAAKVTQGTNCGATPSCGPPYPNGSNDGYLELISRTSGNCEDDITNPNDNFGGDGVCDTPPDFYTCVSGVDINSCIIEYQGYVECGTNLPYPPSTDVVDNLMAYWNSCNSTKHLTPGQGYRMRCVVEHEWNYSGSPLISIGTSCTGSSCPSGISCSTCSTSPASQTLTGIHFFDKDLVSNSNLTIQNATLYFSAGHGLIMNGGNLTISQSTLTVSTSPSSCNPTLNSDFWKGIAVHPEIGVTIDNSTIEFTERGIYCLDDSANSNKPNIWLSGSTLRNNFTSMRIHSRNASIVMIGNTIVLDNAYPISGSRGQIFLSDVPSFYDNGNSFYQNNTTLSSQPAAIRLQNSGMFSNAGNSTFENWSIAIDAINCTTYPVLIRNETFTDNVSGIVARNSTLLARDSDFNVNINQTGSGHFGIFMRECTAFDVHGNNFISGNPETNSGLNIRDSYANTNSIFKNNFDGLHRGVVTIGTNGGTQGNNNVGVNFFCNCHTNNTASNTNGGTDFSVNGPILVSQGTSSESSGNHFSQNSFPNSHFNNTDAAQMIQYHYLGGAGNNLHTPVNFNGLNPIQNFVANSNCITKSYQEYTSFDEVESDYLLLDKALIQQETELTTMLDNGDTGTLVQIIEQLSSSDPNQVMIRLQSHAPNLSYGVIRKLFEYSQYYTEEEITNLFIQNPEVMHEPYIAHTMYRSISDQNFKTIQHSQQNISERSDLQADISSLIARRNYLILEALRFIYTEEKVDHNLARTWMSYRNDLAGQIMVVESYNNLKRYEDATAVLVSLLNSNQDAFDPLEIRVYMMLQNLLSTVHIEKRNLQSLGTTEINTLLDIANTNTIHAASKAKGILEYFYGHTFEDKERSNGKVIVFK